MPDDFHRRDPFGHDPTWEGGYSDSMYGGGNNGYTGGGSTRTNSERSSAIRESNNFGGPPSGGNNWGGGGDWGGNLGNGGGGDKGGGNRTAKDLLDGGYGSYPGLPPGPTNNLGLPIPRSFPPSLDISDDIDTSNTFSDLDYYSKLGWFKGMTDYDAPWDYKTDNEAYEDFGNYNFGMMGAATGIPKDVLTRSAGYAQKEYSKVGSSGQGVAPSLVGAVHGFGGIAPYEDFVKDQYWIDRGITDYYNGSWKKF